VTDAHGVGATLAQGSQTVTDAHGVGATLEQGRHAPQLHELITVHTDGVRTVIPAPVTVFTLRVEYAERRLKYSILFTFSPVYE